MYPIPHVKPELYQYTLTPTTSWIISSIYGQYLQQQPATTSFIDASASWDVRKMIAYSYILPNIAFGTHPTGTYGPYYPGAYVSPIPTIHAIHPSFFYSLVSGYSSYAAPHTTSYIFTDFLYSFLANTYSYIFTEVPIYTALIFDMSLLAGPSYAYAYIHDLSYLALPPYVNVEILDVSYIMLPPDISVVIQDTSNLVYWV
jgi:hypothetical protein